MRYGSRPSTLVECLAFVLGKVPRPVLDVMVGPLQAHALVAAERTGVLRVLGEAPATTTAIARACRVDDECLGLLLRVLRAMGYTDVARGEWRLTARGERYFGKRPGESYHAFVDYTAEQLRMMTRLEKVLRTGQGIEFHQHQSPEVAASYQRAMLENAQGFAWFVVEHLPVPPGARTCLDLAGGHGLVGAALCRRHPPLRSTVLDRPEAIATARQIAADLGHADLVTFREGNVLEDDFGTDADVVLLCNILHHFRVDRIRDILDRVRRALRPGGVVGIFELETPAEDAPPEAAADAFALYFRLTSNSRCFRGDDYERWLGEAGFATARTIRRVTMPSRMLVVAEAR